MLRELRISNLVLIESAELLFQHGLTIITGETGSGKTALLHALSLVTGARSDSSLVRHGAKMGRVEAAFELQEESPVHDILAHAGIDHCNDELLILRRDIDASGKSKSFVNQQMVQRSFLQQLGTHLVNIISQHAARQLNDHEAHTDLLDKFGGTAAAAKQLRDLWKEGLALRRQLEELQNNAQQRQREMETLERQCEEIEEAAIDKVDEEELFALYGRLANGDRLRALLQQTANLLDGERQSVLQQLQHSKKLLDDAASIDPSLGPQSSALDGCFLELRELSHSLERYQQNIEEDPEQLESLNAKLKTINSLKKKYGSSLDDVRLYYKQAQERLKLLHAGDESYHHLEEQIAKLAQEQHNIATLLSTARSENSSLLSHAVENHLASMNMSSARFEVALTKKHLSAGGYEEIEFLLTPNRGEKRISLKNAASGGEMARLMLALKIALAGKEPPALLVFDEIDANIGGETAAQIGQKLSLLAQHQQVMAITHFSQTAKAADNHFKVAKSEEQGRTISSVLHLSSKERQKEFLRMQGG